MKSQLYLRDAVMAFKWMTGLVSEYLTNKFIPRGSSSGIVTEKPLRGVVDKVLYCIVMYATLKKKWLNL